MAAEHRFYYSEEPTNAVWCPAPEAVFHVVDPAMHHKLYPLLSFDLRSFGETFPDTRIHVVHHDISLSWLKFGLKDGKYTFLQSSGKLREIQELEEMDLEPRFLKADNERNEYYGDVDITTGRPISWMQSDETPSDRFGRPMEFLFHVLSGGLFGGYYVFYSKEENTIVQVYQCT